MRTILIAAYVITIGLVSRHTVFRELLSRSASIQELFVSELLDLATALHSTPHCLVIRRFNLHLSLISNAGQEMMIE